MNPNQSQSLTFRLLQWNALTSGFATEDSFPKVSPSHLKWCNRQPLILEKLKLLSPDIFCLEEVDNIEDYIANIFNPLKKYSFTFIINDDNKLGQLIAYDKTKFLNEFSYKLNLPSYKNKSENDKESQTYTKFAIISKFKNLVNGKKFFVINIHLKSKKENEQIRCVQMEFFLNYLKKEKKMFFEDECISEELCPIFICGDFNAEPTYECIKMMKENQMGIKSVFQWEDKEKENFIEFSTFKIRKNVEKRIIDYIWYTDNGKVKVNKAWVEVFKHKEEIAFPNDDGPSDHLPLIADICLI